MVRIATPVSRLFNSGHNAREITESSDCLECRVETVNTKFAAQELFHCHLQPIHELGERDFAYLEKVIRMKPELKLLTFHAASCCNNANEDSDMFQIDGSVFRPGGQQYSREEMLQFARRNFSQIKKIVDQHVKIAIENNNYYPTEAYRYITDPPFIRDVVYENGIYFLFDIAHAKVSAHNRNVNYEDYIDGLPLEKTIQIHICRYGINETNLAYDAHDLPDEEEWREVKNVISANQSVEYLTVEYYKNNNNLIKSLKRARGILNEISGGSFRTEQ